MMMKSLYWTFLNSITGKSILYRVFVICLQLPGLLPAYSLLFAPLSMALDNKERVKKTLSLFL
jgi:hypothetical protein